jgi:hypothetical protein
MFVVMNFRVSIKQALSKVRIAEKKKDLKVTLVFKKELIPFLIALRKAGAISKFAIQKKTIVLCLKKKKVTPTFKQKQKTVRAFAMDSILYKNPVALIFFSSTSGIKSFSGEKRKWGGTQLFLTY